MDSCQWITLESIEGEDVLPPSVSEAIRWILCVISALLLEEGHDLNVSPNLYLLTASPYSLAAHHYTGTVPSSPVLPTNVSVS